MLDLLQNVRTMYTYICSVFCWDRVSFSVESLESEDVSDAGGEVVDAGLDLGAEVVEVALEGGQGVGVAV